jgi:hypothetical protein
MAKLSLMAGTTNYITHVFIQSSLANNGSGLSGLTALSTGLTAYYKRNTSPSSTAISLTGTGTLGSYTSGLLKEVDSINMVGWYELHLPNAVLAAGAKSVGVHLQGAAGMVPLPLEIELTAINNQDGLRMGLTALPAAAAGSAGGLPTVDSNNSVLVQSGTGSGQISLSNGTVTVGTNNDKNGYSLASSQSFSTSGSVGSVTGSIGPLSPAAQSSVAAAVWNEPQQNHLNAGTTGFNLRVAGSIPDPWSANLSTYPSGTAGYLVVQNLDTKVSSRSNFGASDVWAVASRSLTDKSGFILDPKGLDTITIETGVNVRQAVSAILASAAGVLSGAESGPITILGGNVATTRIVATVDSFGNRSSVALTLPSQ